jgi:hypothetical protein
MFGVPETDTMIWMAIKARVTEAAGALHVAWPSEAFSPPATSSGLLPFIAVGDVATSIRVMIDSDGDLDRTGIVSLAYVAPLGYAQEWYIEKAAALLPFFRPDSSMRFQSVCIKWGNGLAVPRVERGYRDDGYFRTPVLIPWRCSAR